MPPSKQKRINALGLTEPKTLATAKAIADPDNYFIPMRMPDEGDWLDDVKHGNCGYDNFRGKKYSDSYNMLYIQPITYDNGSKITDTVLEKLRLWVEAFFTPCKCEVLPRIPQSKLKNDKRIAKQKNRLGKTQYHAIHILKHIIQPIQNYKKGSISVLALTDVDLFAGGRF